MALTLKKFIKYFDSMTELVIMEFPNPNNKNADGIELFSGYTFDKGAKKKLKALYKQNYVLDRNEDGEAVMIFPYKNEHGANMAKAQINVKKGEKEYCQILKK